MENNSGSLVRQRREQKGLTQVQLAELLECAQANVQKIERGSLPNVLIGLKLEAALGISLEKLFLNKEDNSDNELPAGSGLSQTEKAWLDLLNDLSQDDINEFVLLILARQEKNRKFIQELNKGSKMVIHLPSIEKKALNDDELTLLKNYRNSSPEYKTMIEAEAEHSATQSLEEMFPSSTNKSA